jgi:saccharopine dehydrogenase-like NADP-dependent oxidoreductase
VVHRLEGAEADEARHAGRVRLWVPENDARHQQPVEVANASPARVAGAGEREPLVQKADIVISLMPPHLHVHLAKDCLKYKKNLITSSYVSDELRLMDAAVREAGLMFMCEMGLDPGIDHMTANKMIHEIHASGGIISSFKSYCGGLIAPESDDNPWHYKFTWNPKNIITAGVGGSRYQHEGAEKFVPYEQIFEDNEAIDIEGIGALAWYPNRDSLKYLELYELPHIQTFLRATFRYPAFCEGWQALIHLGLTAMDDALETSGLTYADWMCQKTDCTDKALLPEHVAQKLLCTPDSPVPQMLEWLGVYGEQPLPIGTLHSGEILLDLLLNKWSMQPTDKDMVVMQHEIDYTVSNIKQRITSTLVIKGDDREQSAMAKTVGMPMAILAHKILAGELTPPHGVLIPNTSNIYEPVLQQLAQHGVVFKDVITLL